MGKDYAFFKKRLLMYTLQDKKITKTEHGYMKVNFSVKINLFMKEVIVGIK